MGSQKIYLYESAYIERAHASTSYTGSMLKSGIGHVFASSDLPSNILNYRDLYGYSVYHGAFLRFLIPSSLKYKRITNVDLTCRIRWDYATMGSVRMSNLDAEARLYRYDVAVPFLYDGPMNEITWNMAYGGDAFGSPVTRASLTPVADEENGSEYLSFPLSSIYNSSIMEGDSGYYLTLLVLPQLARSSSEWLEVYGSADYPYITITYEDVEQLPPSPSYPVDTYLKEGEAVLFAWQWNSQTPAVQQNYQLEYKEVSDENYTVVTGGAEHSYLLPAGLPAGTYEWRVKVTNDAGEVSDYSSTALFTIIGKPTAPIINDVDNQTLTTITWNTSEQNAFELTLTDSEGKELIHTLEGTTETSFKPNLFLQGRYTIGLRIKNSIDWWSDWVYKVFTINAVVPQAPSINVIPMDTFVKISFLRSTETDGIAIMRSEAGGDFKVIALIGEGINDYEDHTAKSGVEYTYKIREYADGYTDSQNKFTMIQYDGMVLRSGEVEAHLSQSSDKFLAISEAMERETAVSNYSGREFPMIERGEFTSWELERKFFVTGSEREALDELLKVNAAYYRDSKGRGFACALLGIQYQEFMDEGFLATLRLVRTSEEELIVNV